MPRDDFLAAVTMDVERLHKIFAENIKLARQSRGWTEIEAAKRCAISRGSYRKVEQGSLTTAIGVYWVVLDCFGLAGGIEDLAAPHRDEEGRRARELLKFVKR
jgi:transcriptional regulator with XRE-family HTH domain